MSSTQINRLRSVAVIVRRLLLSSSRRVKPRCVLKYTLRAFPSVDSLWCEFVEGCSALECAGRKIPLGFLLFENTSHSHISSNRHFVVLTWGGGYFFFCCSSYFWYRHTEKLKVSQEALHHHRLRAREWTLWWGPARSRLQDAHSEHFQTEVSTTIIFSPCDINPFPLWSSHL